MLDQQDDQTLVRSLVDLGHNLGLVVVAEGVEDEATLVALAELGYDVVQGFHTGRPMPLDDFEQWLLRVAVNGKPPRHRALDRAATLDVLDGLGA
jgi:EAL domain-containing protein (putative c-di-GMP-specific phosphodiesterase class I)